MFGLGFWYRLRWALRFGLSSKEYKFGLRVEDHGRGQVYGGFGDRFELELDWEVVVEDHGWGCGLD